MEINKDEVIAKRDHEGIICSDCMTAADWEDISPNEILTLDDIERDDDKLFFCDKCGKRLDTVTA